MPPASRYAAPRILLTIALAVLLALPLSFLTPAIALAAVAIGGEAVIITTDGDTLTVRGGAGRQFPAIGALAQGTIVAVLAGPQVSDDGVTWMQVRGAGLTGWCSAEWLADAPAGPAPAAPAAPAATPPGAPTAAPAGTPDPGSQVNGGGSPRVSGTSGRGARLRATPSLSGAVVTVIPEGAEVAVTGANVNAEGYAWVPVTYLAMSGWVASGLLAAAASSPAIPASPTPAPAVIPVSAPLPMATPVAPPPTAAPPIAPPVPTSAPAAPVGLTVGGNATIVDTDGFSLRIRAKPGLDAPIVSFAPPGAVVAITAGPQNDSAGAPWYGITYNGSSGWVLAEHLAPVTGTPAAAPSAPPAPAATPVASATPVPTTRSAPTATPSPATTTVGTGGRGQAIVATALRYLGVPYVYGGTTPSGWDCSGFVGYVYQTAAGIALPRSAAQQYRVGTSIGAAQVQAGDMVFFADTFGPGITHNGIALGDGRFVHARSEGYGTVISSLSDPYWGGHYAGAQRP